jgi:lambda family phage portal protein
VSSKNSSSTTTMARNSTPRTLAASIAAHATQPGLVARLIDIAVAAISPRAAIHRAQARTALAFYEGARRDTQRKFFTDQRGPNLLADQGAVALRTQVRHLERNHDITRGAINTLVNCIVGPKGIGVEFQPRRADGTIHTEYAAALAEAWANWSERPEVTRTHSWAGAQRLGCRTWVRDGEAFAQRLMGPVAGLVHPTAVPYSLELMEPDLVPYGLNDVAAGIRQGIQTNAWGQARNYWVYKGHPGEGLALPTVGDMKPISADFMLHLAERDRIGQLRGITRFASVLTRLGDIKDYEESERIAAKIAAMLTGYVKRQAPDGEGYTPQLDDAGNPMPRELRLGAGTIIDTLAVGEDIGLIDSSRPNVNLVHFRNGQLRAFAAGISASYSTVARAYDGTYSAQRQEMVEQWVHYAAATDDFVSMFVAPVVQDFVRVAHMSGAVRRPADVAPTSADDVLYLAPNMPWIDPAKEALAMLTLVRAGFASEVEMIRRRGANPDHVLRQVAEWRRKCQEQGVAFDSDAALLHATQAAAMQDGNPTGQPAAPAPAGAPAA